MDVQPCRRFFLDPQLTFHRRYEALRAFFVEDRPVTEIASQSGYKPTTLQGNDQSVPLPVSQRERPPFLSLTDEGGLPVNNVAKTPLTGPGRTPHRGPAGLEPHAPGRRLRTRNVGVFSVLATPGHTAVRPHRHAQANYPGSKMVPASSAPLAASDASSSSTKNGVGHINDFNFDEAPGGCLSPA